MTISSENREQDKLLLTLALEKLEHNGTIEYSGEFGPELTTFIPFVVWLKTTGHLAGRKVITYSGMRPYYFFLTDEEYAEKKEVRKWVPSEQRRWPSNHTATSRAESWHVYPDYRAYFSATAPAFDRPVLFIQNKFTVEWDIGPINYLPLKFLDRLLGAAQHFHVIYSRPGITGDPGSYSKDHNSFCDYPDRQIIKNHSHVEVLEETCLRNGLDYNRYKLQVLAKCHHFISVQGGGAHLLSCFGNSILLVLHYKGPEFPHAYQVGPYKYLSTAPPLLMVARNRRDLIDASKVLLSTQVTEQGMTIERSLLPILEKLRL